MTTLRFMPVLAFLALAALTVLGCTAASHAQTSYRLGGGNAGQSGTDPDSGRGQFLSFMEQIGALDAKPEVHWPLPQAREIMGELAAHGDLRDDYLHGLLEELDEAGRGIGAAIDGCDSDELDRQVRRLRRLGRETHAQWSRIAGMRDVVIELYDIDVANFRRLVASDAAAPSALDRIAGRLEGYGFSRTVRLIRDSQRIPGRISQGAGTLGSRLLLPLSALQTGYDSIRATVMSYEAFAATRRLPHILEKYEIIAYLGELNGHYGLVIQLVNTMLGDVDDDFERHCRCLIRPRAGVDPFDTLPRSADEWEIHRLEQERGRIWSASDGTAESHLRLEHIRQQLAAVRRDIDKAREAREEAETARLEQVADDANLRRQYEQYVDRQRRAGNQPDGRARQPSQEEGRALQEQIRRQPGGLDDQKPR